MIAVSKSVKEAFEKKFELPAQVVYNALDEKEIERKTLLFDGNPAILHPLTVGLMGASDNEKTVGFLHDLIEDCDWSIEDLQTEGFLDEVVEAVDILTHRKDEDSYDEYVNKIILSGNRLAINVKLNDLHHNLQRGKVSYEAAVASNDTAKIKELERINAKHEKALEMIKNAGYEQ